MKELRKITDFIINKRIFILILFIILAVVSAILSTKVVVNYDMSKYLPSTSETRIGINIMEKEFSEVQTSSFNIMFKGLKEDEKKDIYNYLSTLQGVDSIAYDETEKYNKDDYTMYGVTIEDNSDSELATNIYNDITKKYENYEIYTSGDIADRNTPVLEPWIIGLAILCALIILMIMCESYVEPFLFLTTILIAVLLNKGTDIIFPSVSNITQSISAILQLALSMDYSIMLMSRYNQEKMQERDKVKAMKNALYHAFQSISSSSITTIVGLVVLVLMSFKIGRDLGLVLAKGVLFSLISIFFVLPGLILMFDKWIEKTRKKSPNIKLNILGKISYKLRYIAIPLFIVAFVGSFLLKENLGILYTNSQIDKISDVFQENNQMAVIYKNEDEEKIAKILGDFENNENVDEVLAYSNTINEKLTYDKLGGKMNELGSDVEIEDYLLKILYYNYYNENIGNAMTFNEFVNFIKTKIYNNEKFSNKLDDNAKENIDRLENFTSEDLMNKNRSASEISGILNIDENTVKDILVYYSSKNDNISISIRDFINFVNKDVLTNSKYSSEIDKSLIGDLNTLLKFTDKTAIQTKMSSAQIADLFGLDKNTVSELYKYYRSLGEIDTRMTLSQFSDFVLNNVLTDPSYANSFNQETIENMKLLSTFSNKANIESELDINAISSLFGINEEMTAKVLLLKYMNIDDGSTLTITEFISTVKYLKSTTNYLDGVDTSALEQLDPSSIDDGTKYTATEISELLGIEPAKVYQIYAISNLNNGNTGNWKSSPYDFVKLVLENSNNPNVSSNIDQATLSKLNLLSSIMNSSVNNTSYSHSELAEFIGIDDTTSKSIYLLYTLSISETRLTPQEFVNFVLTHKNDEVLSGKLSANTSSNLLLIQSVMNGVVNNKKYSSAELANLFGINKEKVKLLYGLYYTKHINPNRGISPREFVVFLLSDVAKNPDYSANIDSDTLIKLNTINGVINATLNETKYTASEIMGILSVFTDSIDEDTVDLLYMYYGSEYNYNEEWKLTVEQFIKYLNEKIITNSKFDDFILDDMRKNITDGNTTIQDAKELLVGNEYSRVVLNTKFLPESDQTFSFIQGVKDLLGNNTIDAYVIGDSPMAYEMSNTFNDELDFITILTMIAIFIVVAFTFKSILVPSILVVLIQCAVYMTMGILSFSGESVYFISILIVQSILMGATIDYAILYTSYYLEHRKSMGIKEAIINSYNKSIHTILTSCLILIIVTLIVAKFASAIASKICKTISEGTICSTLLILLLLPAVLAACDKVITRKRAK